MGCRVTQTTLKLARATVALSNLLSMWGQTYIAAVIAGVPVVEKDVNDGVDVAEGRCRAC